MQIIGKVHELLNNLETTIKLGYLGDSDLPVLCTLRQSFLKTI